jgi:hypothetical protein
MAKRPLQDNDVVYIHPSHPTGAASPVHTPVRMDQIAAFILSRMAAPAPTLDEIAAHAMARIAASAPAVELNAPSLATEGTAA